MHTILKKYIKVVRPEIYNDFIGMGGGVVGSLGSTFKLTYGMSKEEYVLPINTVDIPSAVKRTSNIREIPVAISAFRSGILVTQA